MYKVLIVDDEPLIREGLRTIIDWNLYGFEVADTAADGEEVIAKLSRLEPDLVIADIRMPDMDGLQLMRAIQGQTGDHPHFLILSGYAEFDYAREAIQLKVDGYMLKPIDEDELITHLDKLKSVLDQEKLAAQTADTWTPERIVTGLLAQDGRELPDGATETAGFSWPGYEIILIRPQSTKDIHPSAIAKIKTKLSGVFDVWGRGVVFSKDPYLGVVLNNTSVEADTHKRVYKKIAHAFADTGIFFTAVSGGHVTNFSEILHSYRNALDLMRYRFAYEGDRIYERAPDSSTSTGAGAKPLDATAVEEKLFLTLDIGDGDAAAAWIRAAGQAMLASDMSEADIKTAFAQIMTAVIGKLAQSHPQIRAKSNWFAAALFEIHHEYRCLGVLERLSALAYELAGAHQAYGIDQQIKKMTEMIHRNYHTNLKLESLAEVFRYSSTYLGKMFKTATGEYFNTYLDKVRIAKAKEFLDQGMKVYQVAERVGYSSPDYFHSKFRRYAGMSPSDYRKK
jgi:two-component system, response regulator YesN